MKIPPPPPPAFYKTKTKISLVKRSYLHGHVWISVIFLLHKFNLKLFDRSLDKWACIRNSPILLNFLGCIKSSLALWGIILCKFHYGGFPNRSKILPVFQRDFHPKKRFEQKRDLDKNVKWDLCKANGIFIR